MRDFAILFVHLIVTLARLARPGGLRSVVAESVLVRHQLLILCRGRNRAPHLRATDRIIAGLCTCSCGRHASLLCGCLLLATTTFTSPFQRCAPHTDRTARADDLMGTGLPLYLILPGRALAIDSLVPTLLLIRPLHAQCPEELSVRDDRVILLVSLLLGPPHGALVPAV